MSTRRNRILPQSRTTLDDASDRTRHSQSPPARASRRGWVAALALLVGLATCARAAISVPTATPITFDALPTLADGWSTLAITGDGNTVANPAGMDAAVAPLTAASIATALGQSATIPPSANVIARWHSVNRNVQTRPTTVGFHVLMATLQNNAGADASALTITYDFAIAPGIGVTETEVPGQRVYYSLDGLANNWQLIPGLSGDTPGTLNVTIDFPVLWAAGAPLYLLWADDNAVGTDNAYQIDNVSFSADTTVLPPEIVTQPTAETTLEEGRPFTLSVTATGRPLYYQWYRNGSLIEGATQRTYSVTAADPDADSGDYQVVVYNSADTVTSTVAQVTVYADLVGPGVVRATGYPIYDPATRVASLTQVILDFNEPLDPEFVRDGANYTITSEAGDLPVGVEAWLTNNNQSVILLTDVQIEGALYTVTVAAVKDTQGNGIGDTNTAEFRAWVSSPGNGLVFEAFNLVDPDTINTIAFFTNSPNYPNSPDFRTNLWAFDSRVAYLDDTHEHYGSRTRGVFFPPISGAWRFYLRCDDPGQVFLNPTGPGASGKVLILEATGATGDWNSRESAPINLISGQGYYIEALHKEGTGGDYVKVAARLEGSAPLGLGVANTVIDTNALAGPLIGYSYAPADIGGGLTLVGPADVSVQENQLATFAVSAGNPSDLPMAYQWRRDGADIPGANGPTYSFFAAETDNGAQFSVQVSKLGSVALSEAVTLTVNPDLDPPTVVAVHGSYQLNKVIVSFSELMQPFQDVANYQFAGGLSPTEAILDSTGTNVILTLDSSLAPGETYDITIGGVMDLKGNPSAEVILPVRAFVLSRGFALEQLYFDIGVSTNVADLTGSAKFPNSPDRVDYKPLLEGPTDRYDQYGTRLSGWIVPPSDGSYVFYFCSDGGGQLSLSPDTSPANLALIAREISGSAARTWTGPGNSVDRGSPPSNISTQSLAASQMYAFEVLQKEGVGGDNSGVNWMVPGGTLPNNGSPGIPGPFLYSLADPVGASVTITQEPTSYVAAYREASAPTLVLSEDFNAGDGGFTVTNYGAPVGPWSYDAMTGSWTNHGQPAGGCGGPFASGLNTPAITLPNGGKVVVTFAHRHSFEGLTSGDPTAWDGGQVRLSVNGGPFATVPAANFSANGYLAAITGTVSPLLTATPGWINMAFVGESGGYAASQFITSAATLGQFNPGDTLRIQLVTSWDDCAEGLEPNWEITSVQVEVTETLPPTAFFTVRAQSTYLDLPNANMVYVWQRDDGSGFQDIFGAYSPTYAPTVGLEDNGARFRCIVYSPAASATSGEATLTVSLPVAIRREGLSVRISWPVNNAGFVLQRSPTVPAPDAAWTLVPPASYQTDGTSVYVVVSATTGNAFYRLRKD